MRKVPIKFRGVAVETGKYVYGLYTFDCMEGCVYKGEGLQNGRAEVVSSDGIYGRRRGL